MSTDMPTGSIKPQPQTSSITSSDATLVDDTVALVDSTTSLVGGNTVIFSNIITSVNTIRPKFTIKRPR